VSRRSGRFVSLFKPSSRCLGPASNQAILLGSSRNSRRNSRREYRTVSVARASCRPLRASAGTSRPVHFATPRRAYRSVQPLTENSFQVPGTPFSSCSPWSSKRRSDPATKSTTVRDTRMSPGSARPCTR